MDAVKPFIDYHEEVQGLDFRRTIFIFLSNTGGDEINKIAYNSWESGKHRENLSYKVSSLLCWAASTDISLPVCLLSSFVFNRIVRYSLISIRQNYNFDMLATI